MFTYKFVKKGVVMETVVAMTVYGAVAKIEGAKSLPTGEYAIVSDEKGLRKDTKVFVNCG